MPETLALGRREGQKGNLSYKFQANLDYIRFSKKQTNKQQNPKDPSICLTRINKQMDTCLLTQPRVARKPSTNQLTTSPDVGDSVHIGMVPVGSSFKFLITNLCNTYSLI